MASSSNKRRGLGRGLGALIMDTAATEATATEEKKAPAGVHDCAVAKIAPNPHQPREQFDDAALDELAESIKAHGIIQPLVVTADPTQPEHYWLVAGERRWRAAQRAKLTTVPVVVRETNAQQLVELALVENIQRADLNALEEAAAYQTLVDEFGLTHTEVAGRVGKSRSAITNTLRLLQAPPAVQKAVTDKSISAGHARSLLALEETAAIEAVLQEVLSLGLNVRQTEALVKQWQQAQSDGAQGEDDDRADEPAETATPTDEEMTPQQAQVHYMEDQFRSALGTRVSLNRQQNGSGRLVIHFFNDDDLVNIYRQITGQDEDEEI